MKQIKTLEDFYKYLLEERQDLGEFLKDDLEEMSGFQRARYKGIIDGYNEMLATLAKALDRL
jgi:hypothetical protein